MKITALALMLVVAGPLQAQELPQGVRARVWSVQAGPRIGLLYGQMDTGLLVTDEPPGQRCRELVAESSGLIWGIGRRPVIVSQDQYAMTECPPSGVAIPPGDIAAIDISDGFDTSTQDLMGSLGLLGGAATGYFMKASELTGELDGPTSREYTSWWRVGIGALVGSLVGYALAPEPTEFWRQIR